VRKNKASVVGRIVTSTQRRRNRSGAKKKPTRPGLCNIAGLAASLGVELMRSFVVVLFWQLNEVREEAERRVVRAVSHHLNNSLSIVLNRRHLDPNAREQIIDDQLLRCVWAIQTILPALNLGLPELLNIKRHSHPTEWTQPDIEQLRRQQPPTVH